MERLTQRELQTFLALVRDCYRLRDRESFVTHLLHELPRLIPAEIATYSQISLDQGRLLDATRVEPSHVEFSGCRKIFERLLGEHPVFAYRQRTRDGHALKLSDFLTQRQFLRLGLYCDFFHPLGVEYEMTATLVFSPSVRITISLDRGGRDFSERERLLLNLLRPHLVQAYINAESVTRIQQDVKLLEQMITEKRRELVILAVDGRVRSMGRQAQAWLSTYFEPARSSECLPDTLERWRRRQEVVFSGDGDSPPPRPPMMVEREGARLVVRHLCEAERCLLHLEEQPTGVAPAILEPLGLTRRETEVLHWVAQGKTNAEVGAILGVSPRTAQKHLDHIFKKLGVETRVAAAVRASELYLERR